MRCTKLIELIPNNTFGYDDKFKSFDDTFIEKMNYRYTVVMILAFAYLVTSKQINGARKNIECFVPAHLHLNNVSYTDYINEYCYLSLTYYIPHNEHLVRTTTKQMKMQHDESGATVVSSPVYNNEIKYYQLTHYFLILISIFIYIPRTLYSALTRLYDIDLKSLMDAIFQLKFMNNCSNKTPIVSYITHYLDIYLSKSLQYRRRNADGNCCSCLCCCSIRSKKANIRANSNLLTVFCSVKFLYIVNYLVSIKFLNYLLGNDFYTLFGLSYLKRLIDLSRSTAALNIIGSLNTVDDTYFPKVTHCDVYIREIGYNPKFHKIYTVQCALPINLYNEQVFSFLWFWLIIMSVVNTIDFVMWILLYIPSMRKSFFCKYNINLDGYLCNGETDDDESSKSSLKEFLKTNNIKNLNDYFYSNLFNDFLYNYLTIDGVFIFKLISKNFGDFITNDLFHELILKYIQQVKLKQHQHVAVSTISLPDSSSIDTETRKVSSSSSPDSEFI